MIKAAAIKIGDVIHTLPAPNRHHHIIAQIGETSNGLLIARGTQGFIDDEGEFYDRVSAGEHALRCGQIRELDNAPQLFSEDLW